MVPDVPIRGTDRASLHQKRRMRRAAVEKRLWLVGAVINQIGNDPSRYPQHRKGKHPETIVPDSHVKDTEDKGCGAEGHLTALTHSAEDLNAGENLRGRLNADIDRGLEGGPTNRKGDADRIGAGRKRDFIGGQTASRWRQGSGGWVHIAPGRRGVQRRRGQHGIAVLVQENQSEGDGMADSKGDCAHVNAPMEVVAVTNNSDYQDAGKSLVMVMSRHLRPRYGGFNALSIIILLFHGSPTAIDLL